MVGLAAVTWILPPLGLAVTVLVVGRLVGIGLGALVRRPAPITPASPGRAVGG